MKELLPPKIDQKTKLNLDQLLLFGYISKEQYDAGSTPDFSIVRKDLDFTVDRSWRKKCFYLTGAPDPKCVDCPYYGKGISRAYFEKSGPWRKYHETDHYPDILDWKCFAKSLKGGVRNFNNRWKPCPRGVFEAVYVYKEEPCT